MRRTTREEEEVEESQYLSLTLLPQQPFVLFSWWVLLRFRPVGYRGRSLVSENPVVWIQREEEN